MVLKTHREVRVNEPAAKKLFVFNEVKPLLTR